MFEKIGWLKEYWHVIWLSQELKKWKQFKRKVYWIPFLLWRDSQWTLHAFLDVCPHKRAPLDVVDYSDNFVQCSYHGWRFWKEWDILEIPSSPHLLWKIKCKWKKYQIAEQDGFIWIYLDNTKKAAGFPQLFDLLDRNWWKQVTQVLFFYFLELYFCGKILTREQWYLIATPYFLSMKWLGCGFQWH